MNNELCINQLVVGNHQPTSCDEPLNSEEGVKIYVV